MFVYIRVFTALVAVIHTRTRACWCGGGECSRIYGEVSVF